MTVAIAPESRLLIAILAALVAFLFGLLAGLQRKPTSTTSTEPVGSRLAWGGAAFAVAAVCIALASLCAALAVKVSAEVLDDVRADLPVPGAVIPPAAPAAGAVRGEPKDAVSNAMTAVSLSITVITLLVTLGTLWFAKARKELDRELSKVTAELRKAEVRDKADRMRRQLDVLSVDARRGLLRWIHSMGTRSDLLAVRHAQLWFDLELLASDERETRVAAFRILEGGLRCWTDDLKPVRDFTEECHRYVIFRFAHCAENVDPIEVTRMERIGVGCRVFDPAEVERICQGRI